MDVVPMPPRGEWFADVRDGRALRVSWHDGLVVLSTWRADTCVSSVQLEAPDAARLIGVLAEGLGALAPTTALEQADTA